MNSQLQLAKNNSSGTPAIIDAFFNAQSIRSLPEDKKGRLVKIIEELSNE